MFVDVGSLAVPVPSDAMRLLTDCLCFPSDFDEDEDASGRLAGAEKSNAETLIAAGAVLVETAPARPGTLVGKCI